MIISCIKSAELTLNVLRAEYERVKSDELLKDIKYLEEKINYYKESFKKMPEIENRLYYKIEYEGKNTMKAIEEVANENSVNGVKPTDTTYIYKKYFKKIKKYLKRQWKDNKIKDTI